jgi:apolipoprotein N-acyltransferase
VAEWGAFKKTPAVLIGAIPIDRRTSLYALFGDWLPQLCWIVVGAGVAMSIFRRRPIGREGNAGRRRLCR